MIEKREGPAGQGGAENSEQKLAGSKPQLIHQNKSNSAERQRTAGAERSSSSSAGNGTSPSPNNTATPQQPVDEQEAKRLRLRQECQALAREPDILGAFTQQLALSGLVGEERAAKLQYLAVTTRLFDRPVSAAIKGPSSAGKSNLTSGVLRFFPHSAYYALTGMSARAIAYSKEPLRHRFLVIQEASGLQGGIMAYLVRSLVSEGRLRYETVEVIAGLGLRPRVIEREGPTGLLVTTTVPQLDAEIETRLFSIPIGDSPEQTRRVMLAAAAVGGNEGVNFGLWHAFQEWLGLESREVSVPFGETLSQMIPPKLGVRLRRDFPALLSLIRAHALIHRATRELDELGRVLATEKDYSAIYDLVADLMAEGVRAAVSPGLRACVEAVLAVIARKLDVRRGKAVQDTNNDNVVSASLTEVAKAMDRDKGIQAR
jgi:hypothetical protein